MKYRRIDTHFRSEDEQLYQYVMSLVNGWGDVSQIMREAILALKFVREIFGANWQEEWQKLKDVAEKM